MGSEWDRNGTQTPDTQFRVHSPTLLWICLSPIPDLEGLFLFLPGLSLSDSEHKSLQSFPKPQGDRKSPERLLGAGPRRKNLSVFSPIFLKYGFIILQDPPGKLDLTEEEYLVLWTLNAPHLCMGLVLKLDFFSTDYPPSSRYLQDLGKTVARSP